MSSTKQERRCSMCQSLLSELNQTGQCHRHLLETGGRLLLKNTESKEGVFEKGLEPIISSSVLKQEKQQATVRFAETYLAKVAKVYDVPPTMLLKKDRTVTLVRPRQVLMYLLRCDLQMSLPQIGKFLERDHGTVLYTCKKIEGEIKTDVNLVSELEQIRGLISASDLGV